MIEKIDNNQIQDILSSISPDQTIKKSSEQDQPDALLQVDYDELVEQAILAPQQDDSAVLEAQKLIETGQLDTTENITQAAENIINFGI